MSTNRLEHESGKKRRGRGRCNGFILGTGLKLLLGKKSLEFVYGVG